MKLFYQAEGVIGDEAAAARLLEFYSIQMFRPPVVVNFESYGQPVRALDIIGLNYVPLRVMKVESTMEPQKNIWWQTLECEWTSPADYYNLLTARNPLITEV